MYKELREVSDREGLDEGEYFSLILSNPMPLTNEDWQEIYVVAEICEVAALIMKVLKETK